MKKILVYTILIVILFTSVSIGIDTENYTSTRIVLSGPTEAHAQTVVGMYFSNLFGRSYIDNTREVGQAVVGTLPDVCLTPSCMINEALVFFGNLLLWIVSWLTWVAGVMLNISIWVTIFNMSSIVNNMDAINSGWTLIRDISNIFFIFIILYTAIATILELGVDTRKTIVKLIIAALLINFSLFFTKVIIDGSNILTVSIYNQIGADVSDTETSMANFLDNGLSGRIMQQLELQSIYTTNTESATANSLGIATQYIIRVMGGVIFLLIAAIIFFAAAIMFIVRFVIFIFLMITAPVAFIAMILPQTNSISRRWWKSLTSQAIFAPVFMIFLLITLSLLGSMKSAPIFENSGGIGDALGNAAVASHITFLTLIISLSFLVGTLIISKMTGGVGGDWATKVGGRAVFGGAAIGGRFAGRQVGGRIMDSKTLNKLADSNSKIMSGAGRLGLAAGDKIKSGTYDYSNTAGKAASGLSQSLGGGKVDFGKSLTRKDLDKNEKEKIERRMKRMEPSTYQISQAEQAKKESEDVEKLEYDRVKERDDVKDLDTEIDTHSGTIDTHSGTVEKTTKETSDLESLIAKHEADVQQTSDPALKQQLQQKIAQERSNLRSKKSALETAKQQLETAKQQREAAKKRKRDLIETEMASFRKQREDASDALDKLKGVDEEEAKKRQGGKKEGESDYEYKQRIEKAKVKGVGEIRKEKYVENVANSRFGTRRGNAERAKIARDAMKGKKKVDKKTLEELGLTLDDDAGKTDAPAADKPDKDDTKTT